jgi:hypothetical protein
MTCPNESRGNLELTSQIRDQGLFWAIFAYTYRVLSRILSRFPDARLACHGNSANHVLD